MACYWYTYGYKSMSYTYKEIESVASLLLERLETLTQKADILKAPELRGLYAQIPTLPADERSTFGKEINALKADLEAKLADITDAETKKDPIDVTAAFDVNVPFKHRPTVLPAVTGSKHPLMTELDSMLEIFYRMGFEVVESRQIDDDYHMFETLNFPEGHPARDDYDTFMTDDGLIAPAHTSTMQNRVLQEYKSRLDDNDTIQVVIPGRVFRNEDLDATHEHTFYQLEGVYVGKKVTVGNLIATLKAFLETYYQQSLRVKTQPFYFPFTEPSFEFAISRPESLKKGNRTEDDWLELLGCGMIHPNVLRMAGIDPEVYTGFAWGVGIDRLVLMKYGIEDIRHFESARIDFLRQFK